MAYDFHYIPVSGDLSGKSLEEQTARAINELGSFSEAAEAIAREAAETANTGLSVAQDALGTAQTANTLAQQAQRQVEQAEENVQGAYDAAAAAHQRADEAYALAGDSAALARDASKDAVEAFNRAEEALIVASTVEATAENAETTANRAAEDASSALEQAGNSLIQARKAMGVYETKGDETEEELDADTFYDGPEKLYVETEKIVNFPLPTPFYFDVAVSDNGLSVQQFVRAATFSETPVIYIRSGTIQEGSPTWGAWKCTGAETGLWSDKATYSAPSLTFGSDSRLYTALQPSGPGAAVEAQNPVSSPDYWRSLLHFFPPQYTSQTLLAEFTTAGQYAWTVPDLNNGNPYKLFIVVKGAGGGGGLGWRTADNYVHAANGGGEGATLFVWLDTSKPGHPQIGEQIQIIVGAGGAAATAHGNGGGGEPSNFITTSGGIWGALGGGGGTAGYRDGGFGALSDLPLSFGGTWMMLGGQSSDHPVITYATYPHARRGGGRGGAATGVAGCGGTGGQYDDYFNIPARAGGDGYIRIFMMGE